MSGHAVLSDTHGCSLSKTHVCFHVNSLFGGCQFCRVYEICYLNHQTESRYVNAQ